MYAIQNLNQYDLDFMNTPYMNNYNINTKINLRKNSILENSQQSI